jgi:ribosomal protein S18 acetylase RimI-like enzyme
VTTEQSAPGPAAPAVRALTKADAEAVLEVARLCDIAEIGEPDTDLEDALAWLRDEWPGASYGVPGAHGLDAYAWVRKLPGHAAIDADIRIRPGADHAPGPVLLERLRHDAATIDASRPVHVFVHVDDRLRQRWFTAAGGATVRHFWRMVTSLDATVPAVSLPAGAVIRPVADEESDLRLVADVVHTAFEDHFGHVPGERPSYDEFVTQTHEASGFDIGLWWLALVDGAPAAALIGREFADEGIGFVNTLGTFREFRGRGLGRALLLTAFREFQARGLTRSMLGVDASNSTGAVGLYESVGMRAEHTWAVWELQPRTPQ